MCKRNVNDKWNCHKYPSDGIACRMPSGEKEDVVWRILQEGGDRETKVVLEYQLEQKYLRFTNYVRDSGSYPFFFN